MMPALFEDRARPLYGQAEPVRLGRLADADIAAYVRERFEATGRSCGEVLAGLLRVAQGHPQRAMLIAHRLWDETERGETAAEDEWLRALARTRAQVAPELDALWRRLEPSEQRVLRAIAATGGALYREEVLATLGLKKATAHGAAARLVARGELEQLDAGFRFVDPLLEDWLRKEPFAASE
jgi:DNA-binding IclR family transcriptional regulator